MKKIIIYYSLSENTKEAAELIAERIDADVARIDMVKPMPTKFSSQIMYGGMLASFGLKPKIKDVPANIEDYEEIIIGTPIWAGKHAPAINTLLKDTQISSKVTAVFTLSGGGDNDKCMPKLQKLLPNLKYSVALADRKLGKAQENDVQMQKFVEELING